MRATGIIVGLGLAVLLALGFAGAWHPAGDSFAVLRLPLAAGLAVVVIWADWHRRIRWPLAGLALAAMAQVVVPPILPRPAVNTADLVLYQQNLLFSRLESDDWLNVVKRQAPEVLTLQEVSGPNQVILDQLRSDYPTQVICRFATVGAVAVLSRLAPVEGSAFCAEGDGLAALQVQTRQGPVWVVSIHLHWPWPFGQAAQVDRLLPLLHGLDGPRVISGDFNAMRWSHTLRRIARASETRRAGPWDVTFHLPILRAPVTIDHVLAPPEATAEVRVMPKLGSDHHGVLARMSLSD